MPLLSFPEVPEVTEQLLGASHLETYRSGLDYLLGKSHASYALGYGTRTYSGGSGDTWVTKAWLYLRHSDPSALKYAFQARCENTPGGGPWHVSIQVFDDRDAWNQVASETASNQTFDFIEGEVDLSSNAYLTAGEAYRWRIRIKSEFGDAFFRLYGLGERIGIEGWTTVPTFTNTVTSSTDDFNALRTDLSAIADALPPATSCGNMGHDLSDDYLEVPNDESEHGYIYGGWRYRPDTIMFGIKARSINFGAGVWWRWRVYMRDESGTETEVYDSGALEHYSGYTWYGPYEVDLSSHGFTEGDWYQTIIKFEKSSSQSSALKIKGGYIIRKSSMTLSANWPDLNAWEHGDSDIGNTRLTKFSDALTELYSGGEELWHEYWACGDASHSAHRGAGFFGMHGKRWLIYRDANGAAIRYGSYFNQSYKLPDAEGEWRSFDMMQVGIPFGGLFYVTGVQAAWESESSDEELA